MLTACTAAAVNGRTLYQLTLQNAMMNAHVSDRSIRLLPGEKPAIEISRQDRSFCRISHGFPSGRKWRIDCRHWLLRLQSMWQAELNVHKAGIRNAFHWMPDRVRHDRLSVSLPQ